MAICPQCSTPAPTPASRFCDRCGAALPVADAGAPASLDCEICGRPYKTERGRRAHMASVHKLPNTRPAADAGAPWRAEDFPAEDVRTPWLAPPEQPPPRPVPGASSADLPTEATTLPPPPGEPFRWSQPTPAANQPAPPVPPGRAYATQGQVGPGDPAPPAPPAPPSGHPGAAAPGPAYAPQAPAYAQAPAYPTQAPVGTLSPDAPGGAPHGPPFRPLKELAGVIGLLFVLEALAVFVTGAANLFLAFTVPRRAGKLDLFLKVDDNQWIGWASAGLFASLAYIVIIVWLYRAYENQLSLGIPETRLPASVVLVMCFIPVLNLVFMTLALREIWRNADLQRNEWAARSRRSRVPNRLNMIWIGPLLAVVAWIAFTIVVRDRIGADGVTSVEDARALYVSRFVLLFELFWITLAIRLVFSAATEQQERAHWHYQMGRGPAGPPVPPPGAPSAAFPTVPS